MRFFFLLLLNTLLLSGFNVTAQSDCNCSEANLVKYYAMNQDDDSIGIAQLIQSLQHSKNEACKIFAMNMEIEQLFNHKRLEDALHQIQIQENLLNALNCKASLQVYANLNYAEYYRQKEDYENVSKYAFNALSNAEDQHDKKNELKAIYAIVHMFTRQTQYEKNPEYIQRAEKIIASLDEDYLTPTNYNWLAFEYETIYSFDNKRLKILDTAMQYASKAKSIAMRYNDNAQITKSFRVFEACSCQRSDYPQALKYIDSALYYAKRIKKPMNLASFYFAKAWDFLEYNNLSEAIRWQDTSLFCTEQFEPGSPGSMNLYFAGSRLYERAGNLEKALEAFKKYEHIKDSIFTLKRTEKINALELQYNKAKNEKTIRELAQEKRIYILIVLACLFGLISLVFFLRQQSLKSKQTILETEQRLNRARMNPHFFFNALSSLQTFALQGNDGKSIALNLSKFSRIMRETLESTYKEYVTLEQEMMFLNEYLELQKIRFPQKFTYCITADEEIETDDCMLPSMILQPFVENSIEHGFTGIDYPGNVHIKFTRKANQLLVTIDDNGKGFAGSVAKENNEHISRASQIIKDRIYLLNLKLKSKASFSITEQTDRKGVLVQINLPFLHHDQVT